MKLVQHIINLNNRSNNSEWYLNETPSGKITAFNARQGSKTFKTRDEFLSWFKGHSVASIKKRAMARY